MVWELFQQRLLACKLLQQRVHISCRAGVIEQQQRLRILLCTGVIEQQQRLRILLCACIVIEQRLLACKLF